MKTAICSILFATMIFSAEAQVQSDNVLTIAKAELGVRELGEAQSNERIQDYFAALSPHGYSDSVPWCSAFAAFVVSKAGGDISGVSLAARSWLQIGIIVDQPAPGDIVVIWRKDPASWQGHVGFYLGETEAEVFLIGGNQDDQVSIAPFPKSRVLGYRRVL